MSDRSANPIRVVLLARDGKARERLGTALDAAGAELALSADPLSADPAEAIAARPQAVLVALEPAVEDALERFDALLSDPSVTVVFEEAELAAQRDGWDAARWMRHLAAKLNRHDDVLPPGWDHERDLQPSPGALPMPAAPGLDIATLADEAQARAADVPIDELPPGEGAVEFDAGPQLEDQGLQLEDGPDEEPSLEPGYGIADAPLADAHPGDGTADEVGPLAWSVDDAAAAPDDAPGFEPVAGDGFDLDGLDGEDGRPAVASDAVEGDPGFAALEGFELDEAVPMPGAGDDAGLDLSGFDAADAGAAEEAPAAPNGGLELVDVDALLASVETLESREYDAAPPPPPAAPDIDLDALERRVSGLSLADVDSYGHGPERGAVVVEGGLGGPDAVRQLLAAMPEEFPRPVLVRLQLDGGRYDRLVRQMERAARLPVALAEAGQVADAGTIYFVPPALSIRRERGQLVFVADEAGELPLLAALPPGDSAVLLMSGSTAAGAEAAAARIHAGLLAAAQALDGCYDPTATHALAARGGDTGTPAELAERLAARWPA